MIADMHKTIANNEISIEKEQEKTVELNSRNLVLENKKDQLKEEFEGLQNQYLKIKDEPLRLGKGNDNLQIAVDHLKSELDGLKRDTTNTENLEANEKQAELQHLETLNKNKVEYDKKVAEYKDKDNQLKRLSVLCQSLENDQININSKRYEVDSAIQVDTQTKKRLEKNLNRLNKENNDCLKRRTKLEQDNISIVGSIQMLENQLYGTTKEVEEKKRESEELELKQKQLMDEQQIFIGQLVKKGLEDKTMEAKKVKLEKDIKDYNQQVHEFKEEESKWVEEIKFLSTIREKMARTASQAMAQQRETREELKVKELLILDLTKKQQETEFRLNSFIALYEEVKNARNKYVTQI